MINSSIKVLQKYSEKCNFSVMQYIGFQKHSVAGALKVLEKFLKTVSNKVYLQLICIVFSLVPQSPRKTFSPPRQFICLFPGRTISRTLSPLGTSTIVLVFILVSLNSEPQLGKLKEFDNQSVNKNRAFRSYSFFVTNKKQEKSKQALYQTFFNPQHKCAEEPASSISELSHFILDFRVKKAILNIIDIFHRSYKLNFGSLREQVKVWHFP